MAESACILRYRLVDGSDFGAVLRQSLSFPDRCNRGIVEFLFRSTFWSKISAKIFQSSNVLESFKFLYGHYDVGNRYETIFILKMNKIKAQHKAINID